MYIRTVVFDQVLHDRQMPSVTRPAKDTVIIGIMHSRSMFDKVLHNMQMTFATRRYKRTIVGGMHIRAMVDVLS